MIPYDDLVVALTAWRARQGLPVAQPPVAVAQAPRTAPPVAPPPAAAASDDFDGALVEDAPYDAGDDYVVPLGEVPGESTAIGAPPGGPKRW